MDPVTHALVGLGMGALSGQALSPYNPLYCAAVLGSLAPDLDVLALLRGRIVFIRHHRGASHSLPGIALLSLAISLILKIDFAADPRLFLPWALAGALAHVLLDCLNSYGTQIWWPFSQKRCAGNLLMFIDPLLFCFFLLPLFFPRQPQQAALAALTLTALYLALRAAMRARAVAVLQEKYALNAATGSLTVLPALQGLASWDFRIQRSRQILLGTLNLYRRSISNCAILKRQERTPLVEKALQSGAGRFFRQLTAHYHFTHWEEKGRLCVRLLDLRFQKQRNFFYRLTFIFNEQFTLEAAFFHALQETIPLELHRGRGTETAGV